MSWTAKTKLTKEGLRKDRAALLKLAPLQQELCRAIRERMDREKLTLSGVAIQSGASWSEVQRFVSGKSAVGSGMLLDRLAAFAKRPDLGQAIAELAKPYANTHVLGLSRIDTDAISLIYDILEAFASVGILRAEQFASVFGANREIVAGVLCRKLDAARKLEDQKVANAILETLIAADFEERISAAKKTAAAEYGGQAQSLKRLMEPLHERYPSQREVAKALGIPVTTLGEALRGSGMVSRERLEEISQRLQRLQGAGSKSQNTEAAATPSAEEIATSPAAIPASGRPSSDGTNGATQAPRQVLTAETFRQADYNPGRDGIEFARRQLELARSLLNAFAQIKDDKIRVNVRASLSNEVEELGLSIRLFSNEFPNRLVSLYDAERQTMHAIGLGSQPSASKKERRSR